MRDAGRSIARRSVAAAFALACAAFAPAFAGEAAVDPGWAPGLPLPAETGKAAIVPPYAAAAPGESGRCVAPLPCGTRLLGTVRKNGAVELQVPALRW